MPDIIRISAQERDQITENKLSTDSWHPRCEWVTLCCHG